MRTRVGCAALIAAVSLLMPTAAIAAPKPFPVDVKADYQLSGAYPLPPGVRLTSRDWRDPLPRRGYAICYVNGFQSQPEMARWWKRQHPELLLRKGNGRLVADRGWAGEYLLDVTTRAKRHALRDIVAHWARQCATAGYDALEPDNLDSWTRSRGLVRRSHAIAMARLIVRAGHAQGLAVAQKNAVELVHEPIGFDFAVTEDCQVFRECGPYRRVYDDAVLEIEYPDGAGWRGYQAACRTRGDDITVLFRDRLLRRPGHPDYRYASC